MKSEEAQAIYYEMLNDGAWRAVAEELNALKKEVARLEAENELLRSLLKKY